MASQVQINLEGKVAIVTGGRRQLGRAQAIRLAECGADVAVIDIAHDEDMTFTVAAIEKLGRKALPVVCDVSSREQVRAMTEKVVAELGGIDILINNAGISSRQTLMNVEDDEWDAVMNINLKGTILCTQYAAQQMIKQGRGGSITNLSSSTGLNANVSRGCYGVSKAGVIMATQLLAKELGVHNINVNAIAPGFTSCAKIGGRDGVIYRRGEQETSKIYEKLYIKREGEPEDYANTIAFLSSDLGAYITGMTIAIDGGFTIR